MARPCTIPTKGINVLAQSLSPTSSSALPRVVTRSGVSVFAALCASFGALTAQLQPSGGQSGQSEYWRAASRAFDDRYLGAILVSPSGFRLLAQGGVGNGPNSPSAGVERLFIEKKEEAG